MRSCKVGYFKNISRFMLIITVLMPISTAFAQKDDHLENNLDRQLITKDQYLVDSKLLPGKALYFSTYLSKRRKAIWHDITGMKTGAFSTVAGDIESVDAQVREMGRLTLYLLLGELSNPKHEGIAVIFYSIFGLLPKTDYGFINDAARTNPNANFIEHFYAYVMTRKVLKAEAEKQNRLGHPLLMEKFVFMQAVFASTPSQKTTPSELFNAVDEEKPQQSVLQEYLLQQSQGKKAQLEAESLFGKPFSEFTKEEYASFMEGLNLNRDEDIFLWSTMTNIPVVALRKTSYFFRMNLHLMDHIDVAEKVIPITAYQYKTFYNEKTGIIELHNEMGVPVQLRTLPKGLLTPVNRIGNYWHYQNFADSEINYEVIAPYLIPFSDLPYRDALSKWIRKIPLSIVKAYRGKAIYFTNTKGRSFSTTMPVSNTIYKLHAGLKTGVWIEIRSDGNKGTEKNFIHELGHVFDYVVLRGGYGGFRDNYQFPELRKLMTKKEEIFGAKDNKVPNTPFGYISSYAKTNAQENFAEHFRAFIGEKETFKAKAKKEAEQGHPELMRKYLFMELMMENTSTRHVRNSQELLRKEAKKSTLN